MMQYSSIILAGIVGSHAHGLANENSDRDQMGIFTFNTEELFGLNAPPQSSVTQDGVGNDIAFHEVRKFLSLALKSNPSILELLWLPKSHYLKIDGTWGLELLDMRHVFASRKLVRDAYLGYATQQFNRLKARGDSFSADTKNRTEKHARHMARLIVQGMWLYQTGILDVKVQDPEWFFSFGRNVASGNLEVADDLMAKAEHFFNTAVSSLPETPDTRRIEDYLIRLYKAVVEDRL